MPAIDATLTMCPRPRARSPGSSSWVSSIAPMRLTSSACRTSAGWRSAYSLAFSMPALLTRNVPAAGVVAASGGNHGVAVAYAAMKVGRLARIFVPTVSSPAKMDRIRSYGAELVVTGERYNDALLASVEWVAQSGAMPVHAYDQMETLWGAGSAGLEFEEQAPGIDTLLVACGGGGLIGGIAGWYRGVCGLSRWS